MPACPVQAWLRPRARRGLRASPPDPLSHGTDVYAVFTKRQPAAAAVNTLISGQVTISGF